MCGIAGFITRKNFNYESVLLSMAGELKNRGPDDFGVWVGDNVGFCHTRLSIIDLSSAGHQPMVSGDNRYVITYNGEIYNHDIVRKKLASEESIKWRGNSDTEVLLNAIQYWGIEKTLVEIVGMFAFAIYDKIENKVMLARDRFGEKPLYYSVNNNDFVFSSELRPFYNFPGLSLEVCKFSLSLFLKHSNVPAPRSIYKNIFKLEPAEFFIYDCSNNTYVKDKYWSLSDQYLPRDCLSLDVETAVDALDEVLTSAVGRQMCADVPLGAFLSGGVDSTIVTALMQKQSNNKIKTFSIGFDDPLYDESDHARLVAKHLNTDHYDFQVSGRDSLKVIPMLPNIYDEPFSDSSQIPTYLVSKIAKEKVTVALTGDAGDEIFGGYERYKVALHSWSKLNNLGPAVRALFGGAINSVPFSVLSAFLSPFSYFSGNAMLADKLRKLAFVMQCENRTDFYVNAFLSHDHYTECWVNDVDIKYNKCEVELPVGLSFLQEMMLLDKYIYLPNDNLVKVDRAAMSVSLETRCPFLDPEVIAFAAKLPDNYKIRNNLGKWLLRQVLYKYVPEALVEKPKTGFSVPLSSWLRGPLRDWVEEVLDERKIHNDGLLNSKIIRLRWEEHLKGKRNWQYQIWDVLVFQSWLDNNRDIIKL